MNFVLVNQDAYALLNDDAVDEYMDHLYFNYPRSVWTVQLCGIWSAQTFV